MTISCAAGTRDIPQNVILQSCDLERSRSSVKDKDYILELHLLPISTHGNFTEILMPGFFFTVEQSLTKRLPGERQKE